MLTGMFPSTNGNAWIAGFDIKNQLETVQLQIGYCPQFDILWEDLTVTEHLTFYAKIKGISNENVESHVDMALEQVLMTHAKNY